MAPAKAQEAWPTRAVRLVVPSSAGGGTDLYARLLAHSPGEGLKQQFIVEKLADQGLIPKFEAPVAFATTLKREQQMWGDVIRRNKITAE